MPTIGRVMLIVLVAAGLGACASGEATPTPSETPSETAPSGTAGDGGPTAVAIAFLNALAGGDTSSAEAMEDTTMRSAAPAAALAQLWDQIVAQFGTFSTLGSSGTAEAGAFTNVTVEGKFANATVPLIVSVNADGQVSGLHLGAPEPAASSADSSPTPGPSPAGYVNQSSFTETEVTIGVAPWELPGTLAMPTGDGPFPAVVLLAGSGPNDRNEALGPNAPLRDLAWGLASNGIATLRYDKRTLVHGAAMAPGSGVTVHEETMDDAETAVDLLRQTPGVDPDRVFVVGHSLGGYLAPRIAAEIPDRVAGIGMLEPGSSSLAQLILDQYEYLASVEGGADPQAQAALPEIRKQVALVQSDALTASTPASDLPLGVPAAYWLDLRSYDPVATAEQLAVPMFISQGGRDYQVPPSELEPYRMALGDRSNVTIREYPSLNHLLIAGDGPARPAEYARPGHVAAEVVSDLAAWVAGIGG
jgi:dienelactone hydrolase